MTALRAAVVNTSGRPLLSPAGRAAQVGRLASLGVRCEEMGPDGQESGPHGYSVATAQRRAEVLAAALTSPDHPVVWAAQGGFGATEILPRLAGLLPVTLPPTLFVGFSDSCALGAWLATHRPGIGFLHATHALDPRLLTGRRSDLAALLQHLHGAAPPVTGTTTFAAHPGRRVEPVVTGRAVPLNLSIAACLTAVLTPPARAILLLEDVDDDLRRLLRALDVLTGAGWLRRVRAVVLGEFTACRDERGEALDITRLAAAVAERTAAPVHLWPEFGHGRARTPLTFGLPLRLEQRPDGTGLLGPDDASPDPNPKELCVP